MKKIFQGLPAAPGIGIGQIFIYRSHRLQLETALIEYAQDAPSEWQQFLAAKEAVDHELIELGNAQNTLIAEVFSAQRVILQDQTLLQAIHDAVHNDNQSALSATRHVICELAELFRNLGDEYFAGRSIDILDIGQRLLAHMGGPTVGIQQLQGIPPHSILIAIDLSPTELTQLPHNHIQGIALAESTPTAHSAILARTMSIPMACALGDGILTLDEGEAILDGDSGELLIVPSAGERTHYRATQQKQAAERASALEHATESATTQDHVTIHVLANINNPHEIAQLHATGADGVGLLRTEYLFQNRLTAPTVEEQFMVYLELAQQMHGRPLTVRALDAGGDKPMQYLHHHHEENPFLGLRGIRLLLYQPDLLRTQFQALYRVAVAMEHVLEIRFMLPMISALEEIKSARALLKQVIDEESANKPQLLLKIGAMIEIPSAALIASRLAPYVDFFSIGTNDLAQYTLATDRTNASVAALADPLHPAVLQLIKFTCDAATAAQIPVSICGEISGEPNAVPLLLGLGLTELSAPLPAVPLVKEAVRECTFATTKALAAEALQCDDERAVRALITKR